MQRIVVAIGILNLALVSTAVGDVTATLIQQLGSWSKNKAKKASDELAAMGSEVVPELIEALNGKGRRQRRFTARTLRQIGQDEADAIPALCRSLEAPDALTREYAVEALGKMSNQMVHKIIRNNLYFESSAKRVIRGQIEAHENFSRRNTYSISRIIF